MKCLRRILRIRWQERIINETILKISGMENVSCEVRRRRWNWLGHILRREGSNDCKTALGWQPEGKRIVSCRLSKVRRVAESRGFVPVVLARCWMGVAKSRSLEVARHC